MNHITDIAIASALVIAAAVGTMWAVQPRPKPEQAETAQEALKRCEKNPERMCVVRVEPMPAEQKKLQDVLTQIKAINDRAARIEKKLDDADAKAEGKK